MNQKVFVPTIVILLIAVGLFIAGEVWYYKNKSVEVPGVINQTDQHLGAQVTPSRPERAVNARSSAPATRSSTSGTKDMSGLSFAAGTNVELLVINPNLKRTGFDSVVSKDAEDIPNSTYFRDSLSDDITDEPGKEISHQLDINQPTAGIYQVYLIGLESGDYQVSIRAFSQDGSSQPSIVINGQTQKGLTTKHQLQYQKSVRAILKLLPSIQ